MDSLVVSVGEYTAEPVDLADEVRLRALRPYRLDVSEAQRAIKQLAGLSTRRPDLFEVFSLLDREGALFVCHLDVAATKATGQNFLRYHPSDRLMVILAAIMTKDEREHVDDAAVRG